MISRRRPRRKTESMLISRCATRHRRRQNTSSAFVEAASGGSGALVGPGQNAASSSLRGAFRAAALIRIIPREAPDDGRARHAFLYLLRAASARRGRGRGCRGRLRPPPRRPGRGAGAAAPSRRRRVQELGQLSCTLIGPAFSRAARIDTAALVARPGPRRGSSSRPRRAPHSRAAAGRLYASNPATGTRHDGAACGPPTSRGRPAPPTNGPPRLFSRRVRAPVAASYAFSSSSASFFVSVIDGAHTMPQPRVSALRHASSGC